MKAVLALADGKVYEGEHFGAENEVEAEIVFNTSMSGYQEIITDPLLLWANGSYDLSFNWKLWN